MLSGFELYPRWVPLLGLKQKSATYKPTRKKNRFECVDFYLLPTVIN